MINVKRIGCVCSFVIIAVNGMIPTHGGRQDNKRKHSEDTQIHHNFVNTSCKSPRYNNYDESNVNIQASESYATPHQLSLLHVTQKNDGFFLELPHMMPLFQHKKIGFDDYDDTCIVQCSFCPDIKKRKIFSKLYDTIRKHCNQSHFARFIWVCQCKKHFYAYDNKTIHIHAQRCSYTTRHTTPHISPYNGHFVFTWHDETYYICSHCGKICNNAESLSSHTQKCQWAHTSGDGCSQSLLHSNIQPQVSQLRCGFWRINLPHVYLPTENENHFTSMLTPQQNGTWFIQCDYKDFSCSRSNKNSIRSSISDHYNQFHRHKYVYICPYCKDSCHSHYTMASHIKCKHRQHIQSQPPKTLQQPQIQSNTQFCTIMFPDKHKDTNNLEVPIEEHQGGYLGKCPDCMFFATHHTQGIADITQAIRDHFNQEHDTTHIYICRCGQCFYAKNDLDLHLNQQNTQHTKDPTIASTPSEEYYNIDSVLSTTQDTETDDDVPLTDILTQDELEAFYFDHTPTQHNETASNVEHSTPCILTDSSHQEHDATSSDIIQLDHDAHTDLHDNIQKPLLTLATYNMYQMMEHDGTEPRRTTTEEADQSEL